MVFTSGLAADVLSCRMGRLKGLSNHLLAVIISYSLASLLHQTTCVRIGICNERLDYDC